MSQGKPLFVLKRLGAGITMAKKEFCTEHPRKGVYRVEYVTPISVMRMWTPILPMKQASIGSCGQPD